MSSSSGRSNEFIRFESEFSPSWTEWTFFFCFEKIRGNFEDWQRADVILLGNFWQRTRWGHLVNTWCLQMGQWPTLAAPSPVPFNLLHCLLSQQNCTVLFCAFLSDSCAGHFCIPHRWRPIDHRPRPEWQAFFFGFLPPRLILALFRLNSTREWCKSYGQFVGEISGPQPVKCTRTVCRLADRYAMPWPDNRINLVPMEMTESEMAV